ncbi:MAG TPA: methyl-accepting chemotaxis protein [Tepidisphaeraceae bacterium]|jgi:methyl-accepting chemotaxis protein|nr:methyl-accepting chemotaxis protein [Tepidisphaeraceae bacterium]
MSWFSNMPINRKLTLVIVVTCAAMLILAGAVTISVETVTARRAMVDENTVVASLLGRYSTASLMFHRDEDAQEAKKILSAIDADPHIRGACLYDKNQVPFSQYAPPGAFQDFPAQPPPDGYRFGDDFLELTQPVIMDQQRIGTIYLRTDLGRIDHQFKLHATIVGLVLVAAIIAALALSPLLRRPITEPILALADVARRIAEKRDYSARAVKHSQDEIGLLTDAFNQMLGEIESVQNSIAESINVLVSSSTQMLATSSQLAAGAAETAKAVDDTTLTVEALKETAQESSRKASHVSESAQRVVQTSLTGKKSTLDTIEGMQRIRTQVQSVADSMMRLSEQSQTIGQIVSTVEDLAAQSNILAVNAAIEAAKAGDQGRGFSVVAQEVRNLSEQSKQATSQVRTILNDIQNATSSAVMATEQGSKAVAAGTAQAAEAGRSIQTLSDTVIEGAQAATQITASSQQQLAGVDQVALAMESIRQASTQNASSARQLESAAHNLMELGQKLKETVDRSKP